MVGGSFTAVTLTFVQTGSLKLLTAWPSSMTTPTRRVSVLMLSSLLKKLTLRIADW